jgi:hypothetical protein
VYDAQPVGMIQAAGDPAEQADPPASRWGCRKTARQTLRVMYRQIRVLVDPCNRNGDDAGVLQRADDFGLFLKRTLMSGSFIQIGGAP